MRRREHDDAAYRADQADLRIELDRLGRAGQGPRTFFHELLDAAVFQALSLIKGGGFFFPHSAPVVHLPLEKQLSTEGTPVPAFVAGACGFLGQDIPSNQLIKSLELIALGESVMHPHFQQMALTSPAAAAARRERSAEGDSRASIQMFPPRLADLRTPTAADLGSPANEQSMPGNDVVRSLSRRELLILRTLTEGASNKIIARKLVITELTVKVAESDPSCDLGAHASG